MSRPVLEIQELSFSYNGQPVLQDVNLVIQSGDFVALLGPNGGGKTTLLKLALGLLRPDRGHVLVFARSPRESAPKVGYVPQEVHINRSFPISVFDVVLMGRLRPGSGWNHYSSRDRAAARQALERLEMWKYRDRRIGELSGGQRQRVFVARALVNEPGLLLLDEPTASMDAKGQNDLYTILKRLNETATIVVASHDLSIVSSYVRSVACVNQRLYYHDAAELTEEMFEKVYHCSVELVAHGLPHRVLRKHTDQ
jgi:zinc transport system ATP-binding protein